jgi:DNA-directed RNA polymerase beta subunit
MGFIETPYRKVEAGRVNLKGKVSFLSAEEEDLVKIAQSNIEMDEKGNFKSDKIKSRYPGRFPNSGTGRSAIHGRCAKPDCGCFCFIDSVLGAR